MPYSDPDRKREYQREWCAARRLGFFADKTCCDCGSTDDLQLDHLDPNEKVSHSIWSWSQERRDAELAKCVVRCDPCHRGRHALLWMQHGSRKRYEKGCRCMFCVEAMRTSWRRRGKNQRARARAAA